MEPQAFLLADIGHCIQIVDGAGVGRARRANNTEGLMTISAVQRDGGFERLEVDLEVIIDRHEMERLASEAQDRGRLSEQVSSQTDEQKRLAEQRDRLTAERDEARADRRITPLTLEQFCDDFSAWTRSQTDGTPSRGGAP